MSKSLNDKARRAAKRIGLRAIKSRKRNPDVNDQGGFRLVDPNRNMIEAGERYDLKAQDVIRFCQ